MKTEQINQAEFSLMLENYRHSLQEMNALTESEISRLKGLKANLDKGTEPPKAAAVFINNQLFSCLDSLAALAATVPDYTVHGCFTKEERNHLQERALYKLRELGLAIQTKK